MGPQYTNFPTLTYKNLQLHAVLLLLPNFRHSFLHLKARECHAVPGEILNVATRHKDAPQLQLYGPENVASLFKILWPVGSEPLPPF